jgi:hypothetical protein
MNKWLKMFDDAMAAAAFAEEGEFETAREMASGRRTILLALIGEHDSEKAFRFAVNACQRVGADLEILYSGSKKDPVLKRIGSDLASEGISYSVVKVEGCVREAVQKQTHKRSDILFVVVESPERLTRKCKKTEKAVSRSWKDLSCPLVVVSELATAC